MLEEPTPLHPGLCGVPLVGRVVPRSLLLPHPGDNGHRIVLGRSSCPSPPVRLALLLLLPAECT